MSTVLDIPVADRLAVTELYGRYSQAFDAGQSTTCAELFTDTASFTQHGRDPVTGRAALYEFFAAAAARPVTVRHIVSNIVIEPGSHPGTLHGSAYAVVLRVTADALRLGSLGGYRDEFVRDSDGVWRIDSRYFTPAIPDALADAVLAAAPQQ